MSNCVDKCLALNKNVENISNNDCDIMNPIRDKNDSGSQELFSDDDQLNNSVTCTPKFSIKNEITNSSIISLNTPILFSKVLKETPGRAFVPRTPCDLLPFITKTNVLWTSDMETPESKLNEKSERCNETRNSVDINNSTPHCPRSSPNYSNMKIDNLNITSPVLGRKTRCKRRVKRRILNNVLNLNSVNDEHSSISSNSDKLHYETTNLTNNEIAVEIKTEYKKLSTKECNLVSNGKKNEEEIKNFDKNSNTSTQDFFSNASFTSIDQLCSSVIQEEKSCLIHNEDEIKSNGNIKPIKKELFKEEKSEAVSVNKSVLERVAAIRRNQKPIRRPINTSVVIPKDVFSRSVRVLELADLQFNQEKTKALIENKSLKQMPQTNFQDITKLSCIENEAIIKNEPFVVKSEVDSFSQFVPVEMMDDWSTDNVLNNQIDNIHLQNLPTSSNLQKRNSNSSFSTANRKEIIISEANLQKSIKMYKEIEDKIENNNNSAKLWASKQSSNHLKDGKACLNSSHNLIFNGGSHINKLPNLDNNSNNNSMIDKSSVDNKNIMLRTNKIFQNSIENKDLNENMFHELKNNKIISENIESNFLQNDVPNFKSTVKSEIIENELSFNENICDKEKLDILKIKQELPFHEFLESKYTPESDLDDNGFTTAGGKGIKIDVEKERYYLDVFNNMSEDIQDEKNLKKNDLSNFNHLNKPFDKATLVFNTKQENFKSNINNNINATLSDHINILKNKEVDNGKCFITPNSTNHSKSSTIIQNDQKNSLTTQNHVAENKENFGKNEKIHVFIKNDASSKKNLEKNKSQDLHTNENKQNVDYTEKLKQKLNNCEMKLAERCRSFSGFPVNDKGVTTTKLNKSDPIDESFVNQPINNGVSISQFFDSHSDSWLSKIEISHLNNSKVKTPDLKKIKIKENTINEKSDEFLGFSFKDCTQICRQYVAFKMFLKKLHIKSNDNIKLNINSGQSISLYNQTAYQQELFIQCDKNVNIKKDVNESNFNLIEAECKKYVNKLPDTIKELEINKEKLKIKEVQKVIEKRKLVDIDNNTPLSAFKKPRIGSDLQARKLFSDEFNDDDNDSNGFSQEKNKNTVLSVNTEAVAETQENKNLLKKRVKAVLEQEKIIQNKKKMRIHIRMGSLLQQRLANNRNRIQWDKFVNNSLPTACSIDEIKEKHPDGKILDVTASNATCYKFLSPSVRKKKVAVLDLEDGATLIFDEKGQAGVPEFIKAFLAMPGIDPKLIPVNWIENHYKWIVWKLASIDRISFNTIKLPKMLTPERVMKELKYRYDREIDKAERPALRRILEKDDVSTRRMVLCISSIKKVNNHEGEKDDRGPVGLAQFEVEATDGWYSVPLIIDNAMSNYLSIGRIKEGTKIITYGAELLECERGYFPLEKPANVSLKIHTNCTRRARWNTKLGYQKNSRPIPVRFRDIVSSGGMVGETTAVAARTYPLLYREKTPNGQSIFRNARAEEKAASAYERSVEMKMDALYAAAEKNFDPKKTLESDEELENPEAKAIRCDENDWQRKQSVLKEKLESQIRQDLPLPRQVTAILRIRLIHEKTSGILTIWGANEDSGYDIKEGDTITIYNSVATGTRGGELNLMANRITHIKKDPLLKLPYPRRTCSPIPEIGNTSFEPMFNEFDTVGVVISLGVAPYGMKNFEMVNLAHPKPDGGGTAFLSVLFWNGVAAFGYQGMLVAGALVACSNLEWRRNTSWPVPVTHCSDKTVFTCHPRQSHLMNELRVLKALIQNPTAYAESCAEELSNELSKRPQSRPQVSTPGGWPSPWSGNPLEARTPGRPSVQRRLEKLSHYGNLMDTSPPVVLNDSSNRVKRGFTPVTRKNA